ncbi:hypothetical protein RNZ50_19710 [Paracoccaceae bacterium Fryx2]|nr:hypothetical protein [Paracoccaceae bacterium Fryx2]
MPQDDDPPKGESPPATHQPVLVPVKDSDIRILIIVGGTALLVLVGFGVALFDSGLLDFPDMSERGRDRSYFVDTQDYRERRVALSLVLRTFITGFSFVVGLALCTMGGLFILRQVTSLTTITGGRALRAPGDLAETPSAQRLKDTQFSFSAYSPGVVFLVGGVAIMAVTQYLAIPVSTIEVVPTAVAQTFCLNADKTVWEECRRPDLPASPPATDRPAATTGGISTPDAYPDPP